MEVFKLLDLGDFIGVEGNCFTDQNRRADVEGAQAGGAGEIAATVTGKMARLAGRRGALSAALPRSDHERAIARGFRETDR